VDDEPPHSFVLRQRVPSRRNCARCGEGAISARVDQASDFAKSCNGGINESSTSIQAEQQHAEMRLLFLRRKATGVAVAYDATTITGRMFDAGGTPLGSLFVRRHERPEPKRLDQRAMSLGKKVKTALDETRLLILGAQILFGFQFTGVFQDAFDGLSTMTKLVNCAGQLLMVLAIALLIAPSMQHRIIEQGQDTARILSATSVLAGLALVPFALSLGISLYVVLDHVYGTTPYGGTICGKMD
jgi:hypothetical protein